MPVLTPHTANGTIIVPAGVPDVLRPDEIDKLMTAVWVLIFPSLVASVLLFFQGTRSFRYWWSYARLAALWTASIAVVGLGIFAHFGEFSHLTDFLAIAHIQIEWLIMALLLSATATQAIVASTIGGLAMYICLFAFPGIKGTFLVTSIVGGFGDTYIPALLFYGKQWALGLGGVGHFINAYITFRNFVQWTPVAPYLSLQICAATIHAVATVVGVRSNLLHAQKLKAGAISLPDSDGEELSAEEINESKANPLAGANLTRETAIKLAVVSLVVSLIPTLPLSFGPRP